MRKFFTTLFFSFVLLLALPFVIIVAIYDAIRDMVKRKIHKEKEEKSEENVVQ